MKRWWQWYSILCLLSELVCQELHTHTHTHAHWCEGCSEHSPQLHRIDLFIFFSQFFFGVCVCVCQLCHGRHPCILWNYIRVLKCEDAFHLSRADTSDLGWNKYPAVLFFPKWNLIELADRKGSFSALPLPTLLTVWAAHVHFQD